MLGWIIAAVFVARAIYHLVYGQGGDVLHGRAATPRSRSPCPPRCPRQPSSATHLGELALAAGVAPAAPARNIAPHARAGLRLRSASAAAERRAPRSARADEPLGRTTRSLRGRLSLARSARRAAARHRSPHAATAGARDARPHARSHAERSPRRAGGGAAARRADAARRRSAALTAMVRCRARHAGPPRRHRTRSRRSARDRGSARRLDCERRGRRVATPPARAAPGCERKKASWLAT